MAHGDAREEKWRGNWRMKWVASTLHTTSEHDVFIITTADAHTSAASSRLNWRPRRFKWTRPFSRKTKSGFCACAITFQTQSTYAAVVNEICAFADKDCVQVAAVLVLRTKLIYWTIYSSEDKHSVEFWFNIILRGLRCVNVSSSERLSWNS